MKNVQKARIDKTKFFFQDKEGFMTQLIKEISSAVKSAEKKKLVPCFRLNLTSDLAWEGVKHKGKQFLNCSQIVNFMTTPKAIPA
jgi:hypothetical protein